MSKRQSIRPWLLSVLLLCAAGLWAATYSQPFAAGHGFAPTQSGACDNSYTDNAADSTNGNPVNSVNTICNGRNDTPTSTWKKAFTWEAMGVTPGNNVTQVDGKFDHAIIARTHTSTPAVGPLEIMDSGEVATCMASTPNEAQLVYASGTGGTSWATRDLTGAIAVIAGCQASTTTVVVRVGIRPNSGNNASANTQVNVDNLVLSITEVTSSGRNRVIISQLSMEPEMRGW